MLKEQKVKVVEELKERLEKSTSFFLTDFTGLNVEDINQLRRDLKDRGVEYRVVKNTLLKLAVEDLGLKQIPDYLEGPTGVAFGYDDPVIPAKILYDFYKRIEKPKIKVFWLEEKLYSADEFKDFATLPTRDGLLTEVLGCLNYPLVNLIGTFEGVLRELVGTIEAIAESKS
jgi:large subunit ribosomal protein L10